MRNIIKSSMFTIIIIGVFSLIPIIYLGLQANDSIVQEYNIQIGNYVWHTYTINIHDYLINLENSLNVKQFFGSLPDFPEGINNPDYTGDVWQNILITLKYIAKCLIMIPNIFIWTINTLILFPLKLILIPAKIVMALFSINMSNESLYKAIQIILDANIPFIPTNW